MPVTTEPKAMLALADKLASMRSLHGDWRGYSLHVNERDLAIKALRATAGAVTAMRQDEVTVTILALGDIENTPAEAVHHGLEYARKAGFIESWSDPIASNATPAGADTAMREALKHLGNAVYFASDIHPDDRNEALDNALAYYNAQMPHCKVEPSGLGYQRLIDTPLLSQSAPAFKASHNSGERLQSSNAAGAEADTAMREATIEECAKICDRHAQWAEDKIEDDSTRCQVFATTSNAANDCAALIRDRLSTSATLSKSAPEET